jgi:hypothetical protein
MATPAQVAAAEPRAQAADWCQATTLGLEMEMGMATERARVTVMATARAPVLATETGMAT